MNGRQAAREAAKHIQELEIVNALQARDIRDYNDCIQDIIKGGDPCKWCEEQNECQLQAKGNGCTEWWLRYPKEESDAGEGVHAASTEG